MDYRMIESALFNDILFSFAKNEYDFLVRGVCEHAISGEKSL